MSLAEIKKEKPGYYWVSGVLSFASVPKLRDKGNNILREYAEVYFDFKDVTRSDSAALALLIAWLRFARLQGKKLHFINMPKQLLDLAKLSNLDNILPI